MLGYPGFLMYDVFEDMVDPQSVAMTIQQTPNPAAHVKEDTPPFDPHSELERQVPKGVVVSPVEHSRLGN